MNRLGIPKSAKVLPHRIPLVAESQELIVKNPFKEGDDVVHKTDQKHRMTVIRCLGSDKVVCRWKEKAGFKSEEFLTVELEPWTEPPSSYPTMKNVRI